MKKFAPCLSVALFASILMACTPSATPAPTSFVAAAPTATTAPAQAVPAAEIKILSGIALKPAMIELIPQFVQSSGYKVTSDYGVVGDVTDRIQKGEAADVVIVSGAQIDALEKQGKVAVGSRVDLAKVGVGVFVRKGAPKPDISSVEALKRTLLAAKSIGYADRAAGGPLTDYLIGVMEQLGITAEMQPKTTMFTERPAAFKAVAQGDVELGFNQISVILDAPSVGLPSVAYVGPMPAAIQNYTEFAAGIVANSTQTDAAKAFIRFISSPAAVAVMKAKGFE